MATNLDDKNKALGLAFDKTLFHKRDYSTAEPSGHPQDIQHSASHRSRS